MNRGDGYDVDGLGDSHQSSRPPGILNRTVLFSGRVQGVGFRHTTCRIARGFPVTGFVRNLADGRVEAVAEGPSDEVERFFLKVADEMAGLIRETVVRDEPARAQFADFSIRY